MPGLVCPSELTMEKDCKDNLGRSLLLLLSLNSRFLLFNTARMNEITSRVFIPRLLDACSKLSVLIMGPDDAVCLIFPK
jgi:hypothetical protein